MDEEHVHTTSPQSNSLQSLLQRVSGVSAIPSEDFFAPSTWLNGKPQGLRVRQQRQIPPASLFRPVSALHYQERRVVSEVPSGAFFATSTGLNDKPQGSRCGQEQILSSQPIHPVNNALLQDSRLIPDVANLIPSTQDNGRPRALRRHETDWQKPVATTNPILKPSEPPGLSSTGQVQHRYQESANRGQRLQKLYANRNDMSQPSHTSSNLHQQQGHMNRKQHPQAPSDSNDHYQRKYLETHQSQQDSNVSRHQNELQSSANATCYYHQFHTDRDLQYYQQSHISRLSSGTVTPRPTKDPSARNFLVPSEATFISSEREYDGSQGMGQSQWDHRGYAARPVSSRFEVTDQFKYLGGRSSPVTSEIIFVPSEWDHTDNPSGSVRLESNGPFATEAPYSHTSFVPSEQFFHSNDWVNGRPQGIRRSDYMSREYYVATPASPIPNHHNAMVSSENFFGPSEWQIGRPKGLELSQGNYGFVLPGSAANRTPHGNGSLDLTLKNHEPFDTVYRHADEGANSCAPDLHDPSLSFKTESEQSFDEGRPPVPNSLPQRRFTDFTGAYSASTIASRGDPSDPDSGTIVIGLGMDAVPEEIISPNRSTAIQLRTSSTLVHADILSTPAMQDLWSHAMLLFDTYELEASLQQFRRIRLRIPPSIHSVDIPNSALLWANNGLIRFHLGDNYRASKDLRKACVAEPHSSIFWFLLGTIMWELDLWRRAFLHFNTALAVFPAGVDILDYRERGLDLCLDRAVCKWNGMMAWYWIRWKKSGNEVPEEIRWCGIVRCPGGKLFGPRPVA
jgi:hypothetical protein